MLQFEKNGICWRVAPESAAVLERLIPSLDQGEKIKESPAKVVSRQRLASTDFYIKRYRHAAIPLRPLKYYFKPSEARQEWDVALQAEALGIPIVRHIALGEIWKWWGLSESILVTEGFDGTPLTHMRDVDPHTILQFVHRLHDRGFLQHDLHTGNILVSNRDHSELRLVDLYHSEIKPNLTPAERNKNLAFLGQFLALPVSPEIARASRVLRKRVIATRAKRSLKQNRDFQERNMGGLAWQVRKALLDEADSTPLEDPEKLLSDTSILLKNGRSATVALAGPFVLKRYNSRKLNWLKDCFRRSKARQAFWKAYHLELLGIPTSRGVAVAEKRVGPFLHRSYFIMETIPGAVPLSHWLGDEKQPIESVARLVAQLHNEGFSHSDLKHSNILFDPCGVAHIIDMEGLRFLGSVPESVADAEVERLFEGWTRSPLFREAEQAKFRRLYQRFRDEF